MTIAAKPIATYTGWSVLSPVRGRFCARVFPRGSGLSDRLQMLSGRYTMEKNRGLDRLLIVKLPAVVVLSVAGNAIDTAPSMKTLTTLEVGMQLYNFAQVLVQRGVQQVVVCQVFRRKSWRHLTQDVGTARISEINEFLRTVCDDEHLSFWHHKGFWNSQKKIFRRDGVHFNGRGHFKLWNSVQGSCFGAMKRLQQL